MRLLISVFLLGFCLFQAKTQIIKEIRISKAVDPIILDGLLNEVSWQNADVGCDYYQNFPTDTVMATAKTELRFTYDDKFIYVAGKMYNTGTANYVTPSLRRDFRGAGNDMLTIAFDTFSDRTNAFQFGMNPFGVRREGLVSNGGAERGNLSLDWENKWFGEVTQNEDYWIVEMAIPFKSIRYKEGTTEWYINSYRIDSNTGERSIWNPVPRNFALYSQAHTGKLIWDKAPQYSGPNVSVIPYILGNTSATGGYAPSGKTQPIDRQSNSDGNLGFDAKIGLGAGLNLDLTVKPDFSQVEVDRQVTNLDRFEIFFPERRQFFLENADLFGEFGADGLRPFFSRRIGVSRDESTGQNVQNTINFGARLSGKLNNNWRIGILNMQAAAERDINLPKINYTVAAIQRKIFSRSNFGLIMINKQDLRNETGTNFDQFNRVLGFDYNLASADNKWNAKFFYHQSFDKNRVDDEFATALSVNYQTIDWGIQAFAQKVGDNYNPQVGFIRRSGYQRGSLNIRRQFYPQSRTLQRISPVIGVDFFQNELNGTTDSELRIGFEGQGLNTSRFKASLVRNYIYLFSDFDPTREGNQVLSKGSEHTFVNFEVSYNSDTRKEFFFTARTNAGEFFNGNRISLGGNLNYRFQPYGIASLDFNYNRIRLPDPYGDANIFLIGPRFDVTFSKKLFWTTFIQYNSQIDNININSRLQWRFKPVSDIFIAYTDNYFPDNLINKNRALVIKATYWLNL